MNKLILAFVIVLILVVLYLKYMSPELAGPATGAPVTGAGTPAAGAGTPMPANSNAFTRTVDFLAQCPEYTRDSKGVSNECLRKLWKNAGCSGENDIIPPGYNGWWTNQKFDDVVSNMKYWADHPGVQSRNACYGSDTTKWPRPKNLYQICPGYKPSDTGLPNDCLRNLWASEGCTTGDTLIPDNYNGWWKQQTFQTVIADMDLNATYAGDVNRERCYGSDKSKWPKASDPTTLCSPEFKAGDRGLDEKCLRKVWRNAGCTTGDKVIPDGYSGWWKDQTFEAVVADMSYYANSPNDAEAKKICYGP